MYLVQEKLPLLFDCACFFLYNMIMGCAIDFLRYHFLTLNFIYYVNSLFSHHRKNNRHF